MRASDRNTERSFALAVFRRLGGSMLGASSRTQCLGNTILVQRNIRAHPAGRLEKQRNL
jgi:hypothetical protein